MVFLSAEGSSVEAAEVPGQTASASIHLSSLDLVLHLHLGAVNSLPFETASVCVGAWVGGSLDGGCGGGSRRIPSSILVGVIHMSRVQM